MTHFCLSNIDDKASTSIRFVSTKENFKFYWNYFQFDRKFSQISLLFQMLTNVGQQEGTNRNIEIFGWVDYQQYIIDSFRDIVVSSPGIF